MGAGSSPCAKVCARRVSRWPAACAMRSSPSGRENDKRRVTSSPHAVRRVTT
jgi:hypothetical protein